MALDQRYHPQWEHISRYVRQLFNSHCAKCGEHCTDLALPEKRLQVHHIDENPANNALENLIPLCATCHLQIEHEARLHAPYQDQQLEFFTQHTYHTAMQAMRTRAFAMFSNPSLAHTRLEEDYEERMLHQQIDDFDY